MADFTEFWLKQVDHFCQQVSQCTSHIEFLSSCINVRIPPKGLTLKIPISAMPPTMHDALVHFGHISSLCLTQFTLDMYVELREVLIKDHLVPLVNVTCLLPAARPRVEALVQRISASLSVKREHNWRKLSSLFQSYLKNGISLPINNPSPSISFFPPLPLAPPLPIPTSSLIPPVVQSSPFPLPPSSMFSLPPPPLFSEPPPVQLYVPFPPPLSTPPPPLFPQPLSVPPPMSATFPPPLFVPPPPFSPGSPQSASILWNSPPPSLPVPQTPPSPSSLSNHNKLTQTRLNQPPMFCNLTGRTLSSAETSLLSKGLSFSPTPRVDHIRLHTDIQRFLRDLKWTYFWATEDAEETESEIHPSLLQFKESNDNEAPRTSETLNQYIQALLSRTSHSNFLTSLTPHHNLSLEEKRALQVLQNDHSIRIMRADKGSTVVIMRTEDYQREALRQLNDEESYLKLNGDPSDDFKKKLNRLIKRWARSEDFSAKDRGLLVPENPRVSEFYLLMKIHKPFSPPHTLPPGRPIVSSYDSLTEPLSAYIDHILQPLASSQPSFLKDSYHFLEELNGCELPPNPSHPLMLVTIDVNALYTSIPHREGLAALRRFLDKRPTPHSPSTEFILEAAEFVLTHNYFRFEDDHFLQVKGTAMGTRFAPSYANLYMAALEQDFLASRLQKPVIWRRFLDDIFVVWEHGPSALQEMMEDLDSEFTVTFSHTASPERVTFLDVDVVLEGDQFSTDVHIKPSNSQMYLHYNSCHPPHIKKSIPRSLSIRGHRICSKQDGLNRYIDNLENRLQERGYPKSLLRRRIVPSSVKYTTPTNRIERKGPFLVTTYFPGIEKLSVVMKELHDILLSNPETANIFPGPFTISYRRPKNLGNLLSHRRNNPPVPLSPPGLFPCGDARCKMKDIVRGHQETFTSPNTPITYPVRGSAQCNTPKVIYNLHCKHCSAFYIGKSWTPLNLRVNNHRTCVRNRRGLSVDQHAAQHSKDFNDCYTISIVRRLPPNTTKLELRLVEQAHIWLLGANRPPGLNVYR